VGVGCTGSVQAARPSAAPARERIRIIELLLHVRMRDILTTVGARDRIH
jgi:hypothetical protein